MVVEILCHYITQASSDQNKKGKFIYFIRFYKGTNTGRYLLHKG